MPSWGYSHGRNFVNSDNVLCEIPSLDIHAKGTFSIGKILISISNNGKDFSSEDIIFTYVLGAEALSIQPVRGTATGNTTVTVSGKHFIENSALSCKFGNKVVKATFRDSTTIECLTPSHQNVPDVQTITISSPLRGENTMHVERLDTFADTPQRAVQTITIGGSIVLHQVQKVELYGPNLAEEFSSIDTFSIKATHSGSTSSENLNFTATSMDLRQAVEKLPGTGNVVHVTRQDSDGRRGFLWYVTFISIIGNAVPKLECETGVLNYNCDVSIVQAGTLPMSGNISIGHFSHVTRPLAFNSEADAIKMALENLPSTKGSVTVLRRSFFRTGRKSNGK